MTPSTYRFSNFEFDANSLGLMHQGKPVPIRPQAAKLLHALLQASPEHVPREELQQRLWKNINYIEVDGALNACVRELRNALGDSGSAERFIETLPKRGYRFVGEIQPTQKPVGRHWLGAASLLFITTLVFAYLGHQPEQTEPGNEPILISVLPADLPGDDGRSPPTSYQVAMQITAALRDLNVPNLSIISSDTVRRNSDDSVFLAESARADFVLRTAITRDDGHLLVKANLLDVTDRQSKSQFLKSYPDQPTLVTRAVPDDIVTWMVDFLGIEVPKDLLSNRTLLQPELIDKLIQARWYREMPDLEAQLDALALYDEILEVDPDNTEALCGKLVLLTRTAGYTAAPILERYDEIERLAYRIKQSGILAGGIPDLGLAFVRLYRDWDIEAALQHSEASLMIDPQNAQTYTTYSAAKAASGDFGGAIRSAETSLRIRPNDWARADLCYYLLLGNELDRAIDICQWARETAPKDVFATTIYAVASYEKGNEAEALTTMIDAIEQASPGTYANDAARPGSWQEFSCQRASYYSDLFSTPEYQGSPVLFITAAYYWSQCGNREQVLNWVAKSMQSKGQMAVFINVDPRFRKWRSDPDFRKLVAPIDASNT
ncbi:MAG TPA: winged helix-turn-helix domain-containing protein [Woeseiaceae bacterium]|nr:winged helix-turn-helix domain-containing protein [Woeseiaceae bacterium]